MTVAEFEYRIAVGWIAKAALEADDSYLLSSFPVQSDQFSIYVNPWSPPVDEGTTWPAFTRYGQYSNTAQWADGPIVFDWSAFYWTELMVSYFEGRIWGGVGMYPNATTQSEPVTVKTRKYNSEFGVYQCYANRPRPNQDFRRGYKGVEGYRIPFVRGTEIYV